MGSFGDYQTSEIEPIPENSKTLDLAYSLELPDNYNAKPEPLLVGLKTGIDLTLPGHNWLGPGTDVVNNILEEKPPNDSADYLAMKHDFDYLLAKNDEQIVEADLKFLKHAKDLESSLAGYALLSKNLVGLNDVFKGDMKLNQYQRKTLLKHYDQLVNRYSWVYEN